MTIKVTHCEAGTRAARAEGLAQICRQFDVDILYVFGSRSMEVRRWLCDAGAQLSPGPADVDVGVKAARPLPVDAQVRLALALEDFLGVTRVDLVSLTEADPFLAANVVRGERWYARGGDQADEYDLFVLRRAGDLAPLERERMALVLGKHP